MNLWNIDQIPTEKIKRLKITYHNTEGKDNLNKACNIPKISSSRLKK